MRSLKICPSLTERTCSESESESSNLQTFIGIETFIATFLFLPLSLILELK